MKLKITLETLNLIYIVILWALTYAVFGSYVQPFNIPFISAIFINAIIARFLADVTVTKMVEKRSEEDVVVLRIIGDNNRVEIETKQRVKINKE